MGRRLAVTWRAHSKQQRRRLFVVFCIDRIEKTKQNKTGKLFKICKQRNDVTITQRVLCGLPCFQDLSLLCTQIHSDCERNASESE